MDAHKAHLILAKYIELAKEIERDYSVKLTSRLTYDENGFKFNAKGIHIVTASAGEKEGLPITSAITKIALEMCKLYKLNPNKTSATGHKIYDYNTRARKNKFILQKDGKNYIASLAYVKSIFYDPKYWNEISPVIDRGVSKTSQLTEKPLFTSETSDRYKEAGIF